MTSPQGGERPGFRFIEQARNKQLARDLATQKDRIARKLMLIASESPKQFEEMGGVNDELGMRITDPWAELGVVVDGTVNGITEVGVGFSHYFNGKETFFQKVGVNTQNVVSVNMYTDRDTFNEVQELYAYDWGRFGVTLEEVKEEVADKFTGDEVDDMTFPGAVVGDDLWTYYFADHEGNYAKVVGMPKEVARGRRDLMIEGHKIGDTVSVQVPMMARDFVLMRNALNIIEEDADQRSIQPK